MRKHAARGCKNTQHASVLVRILFLLISKRKYFVQKWTSTERRIDVTNDLIIEEIYNKTII